MTLSARRVLDVEDGTQILIDPAHEIAWADGISIVTLQNKVRVVYPGHSHTITSDDADALVADGFAVRPSDRLFDRPELCDRIFRWDSPQEFDFIERYADGGRVLEYGPGTGRILVPLLERGIRVDGLDISERSVSWLRRKLDRLGFSEALLIRGDMTSTALPGTYDLAVSGLNTVRYISDLGLLRRHFHVAAESVRPGGRYVFLVASFGQDAEGPRRGPLSMWRLEDDGDTLEARWSLVLRDRVSRLDLEHVHILRNGETVVSELQPQISLNLVEWRAELEKNGEWAFESLANQLGEQLPEETMLTGSGSNYWFVARRLGAGES